MNIDDRSDAQVFEDNKGTFTLWLILILVFAVPISYFGGAGFFSTFAIVGTFIWFARDWDNKGYIRKILGMEDDENWEDK